MNNRKYEVVISRSAQKEFSKLDSFIAKKIKRWIDNNLVDCENPYFNGKQLRENLSKYWRYRIGNYRILTEIDDLKIIIFIIKICHRKYIYG